MSDNELDELLSQLKGACKKNRHAPSNEANLAGILKRIDVFITRHQMKSLSNQKRLDELQRDLYLSESERSKNRAALETKDFEMNQLHLMLNKAERTTQSIMMKYDQEVQTLSAKLSDVQHEYSRLKTKQKNQQDHRPMTEIHVLRERNQMLEIDNQRLYAENDRLRQTDRSDHHQPNEAGLREKTSQLETLVNSLQCSNQQANAARTVLESKIQTLERDMDVYRRRADQHEHEARTSRPDEVDKLRLLLNQSEQQCNLLRLDLQRLQTDKEIMKIRLIEQKMMESNSSGLRGDDSCDYERFIRSELEVNIDQANKLISYWSDHKRSLEEKIQRLTHEIHQLKTEKKTNDLNNLSMERSQYNENILHAKRDMNQLHMEVTDKNTTIYNLYKKIECLEQALSISKQRMNAQLKEIEELRSTNQQMATSMHSDHV